MLANGLETGARGKDAQAWPLDRKVALVLEGLRGFRPITEICREVGIPTARYYQWRDLFLRAGASGLAQSESERRKLEKRVQQLEADLPGKTLVEKEISSHLL